MSASTKPDTIVLVHGFWVTPRSWENWKARYIGNVDRPPIIMGPGSRHSQGELGGGTGFGYPCLTLQHPTVHLGRCQPGRNRHCGNEPY